MKMRFTKVKTSGILKTTKKTKENKQKRQGKKYGFSSDLGNDKDVF